MEVVDIINALFTSKPNPEPNFLNLNKETGERYQVIKDYQKNK